MIKSGKCSVDCKVYVADHPCLDNNPRLVISESMHSINSHGSQYNNIYCIITFMKPQPCSYMGIEWYLEKRGSWKILVDLEIS